MPGQPFSEQMVGAELWRPAVISQVTWEKLRKCVGLRGSWVEGINTKTYGLERSDTVEKRLEHRFPGMA